MHFRPGSSEGVGSWKLVPWAIFVSGAKYKTLASLTFGFSSGSVFSLRYNGSCAISVLAALGSPQRL